MSLLRGGGAENAGPENEGPSVIVSGHENVCKWFIMNYELWAIMLGKKQKRLS